MEDKTKEILDEINNETYEMDVSQMEIEGILNLKKFKLDLDSLNSIFMVFRGLFRLIRSAMPFWRFFFSMF